MQPVSVPLELSFHLPKAPHTLLQCHLTFRPTSIMLFLTTSVVGEPSSTAPMGSFVYAMPDVSIAHSLTSHSIERGHVWLMQEQRTNSSNVISTALYSSGSSIDYTTRLAKILVRKTATPVYVSCSMNFAGLTVEEEMEGLTQVVDVIMTKWTQQR